MNKVPVPAASSTGTGTVARPTGTKPVVLQASMGSIDAATSVRSTDSAVGDAAITPSTVYIPPTPKQLRELRRTLTCACRATIAHHLTGVLWRGSLCRVHDALTGMYAGALRAFCRHTSFSEDEDYRRTAHRQLPRMAATMLLRELRANPEMTERKSELILFASALTLVQQRRGRGFACNKLCHFAPSPECDSPSIPEWPSEFEIQLGLRLNFVAGRVVSEWAAHPPSPAKESMDLGHMWHEFGDRAGIDRKEEWAEWRERLKTAGRYCPMQRFYEEARITHSRFHEGWLGRGIWPDESEPAQRVLEVMARPISSWPLKEPKQGRGT